MLSKYISKDGGYMYIRYSIKNHINLKSRDISLAQTYWLLMCQIVLQYCTGRPSITVVLGTNFSSDLTIKMDAMDKAGGLGRDIL